MEGTTSAARASDSDPEQAKSLPADCSCIDEALDTIQAIDEDRWKLRNLSFEGVVQIQKHIMAQGCRPLKCLKHRVLPATLTVVFIVCDRLAEIFECLSIRVQRATRNYLQGEPGATHMGA